MINKLILIVQGFFITSMDRDTKRSKQAMLQNTSFNHNVIFLIKHTKLLPFNVWLQVNTLCTGQLALFETNLPACEGIIECLPNMTACQNISSMFWTQAMICGDTTHPILMRASAASNITINMVKDVISSCSIPMYEIFFQHEVICLSCVPASPPSKGQDLGFVIALPIIAVTLLILLVMLYLKIDKCKQAVDSCFCPCKEENREPSESTPLCVS